MDLLKSCYSNNFRSYFSRNGFALIRVGLPKAVKEILAIKATIRVAHEASESALPMNFQEQSGNRVLAKSFEIIINLSRLAAGF